MASFLLPNIDILRSPLNHPTRYQPSESPTPLNQPLSKWASSTLRTRCLSTSDSTRTPTRTTPVCGRLTPAAASSSLPTSSFSGVPLAPASTVPAARSLATTPTSKRWSWAGLSYSLRDDGWPM